MTEGTASYGGKEVAVSETSLRDVVGVDAAAPYYTLLLPTPFLRPLPFNARDACEESILVFPEGLLCRSICTC